MKPVSVHVVYDNQFPEFITLRIEGEVRIGTMDPIEKNLENLYPVCQGKKVLFDLTEVNFVSSSGWSLFLTICQRIVGKGGRFLLTGMNPEVHSAFELLEFQEFMENYSTPAAAYQEALEEELLLRKFPPQRIGFF